MNKSWTQIAGNKLIDLGNMMVVVGIVGVALRPEDMSPLLFPVGTMLTAWGAGWYLLVKRSP